MRPPTEVNFMRMVLNSPICAKCKKPVEEIGYAYDPHARRTKCHIRCHGRETEVYITDEQLAKDAGKSIVAFSEDADVTS